MLVSCKSFFPCRKASVKIGVTRKVGHSSLGFENKSTTPKKSLNGSAR
jgi:hypothetical protein